MTDSKEARQGLRGVARLNAKTVADAEAAHCRRLGIASLDVALPVPAGPARLTPKREAEIAERESAAYPGPWRRSDGEGSLERYVLSEDDIFAVSFGYRGNNTQAEADFIAHARADVPALLAELAAVRKERDEAQAELSRRTEDLAFLERATLPDLRREVEHHQAGKRRWRDRAERAEARLSAVLDLCDREQRNAIRWENPIPVPEWVATVQKLALGDTESATDGAA
jgi:hypothetical protein